MTAGKLVGGLDRERCETDCAREGGNVCLGVGCGQRDETLK